jgi:hypothetical protein
MDETLIGVEVLPDMIADYAEDGIPDALDSGEITEWDEEKYGKLPDGLIFAPDPSIKVTVSNIRVVKEDSEITEWDEEKYGKLPDGLIFAPDPNVEVTQNLIGRNWYRDVKYDYERGVGTANAVPVSRGNIPRYVDGMSDCSTLVTELYADRYFTGLISFGFDFSATGRDFAGSHSECSNTATLVVFLVQRDSTDGPGTVIAARSAAVPIHAVDYIFSSLNPDKQYFLYFALMEKSSLSVKCNIDGWFHV